MVARMRYRDLPASPFVSEILGSGGWLVEAVRLKLQTARSWVCSRGASNRGEHESEQGSGPDGHETQLKDQGSAVLGSRGLDSFLSFCGLVRGKIGRPFREILSRFACESRRKG